VRSRPAACTRGAVGGRARVEAASGWLGQRQRSGRMVWVAMVLVRMLSGAAGSKVRDTCGQCGDGAGDSGEARG